MIPEGYELGEQVGPSTADECERLRRSTWRPLRRMMLEDGVTARVYVTARARWRAELVRYLERYCPPIVFRLVRKAGP